MLSTIVQEGKDNSGYEFGVFDHVESLKEVNRHGQRAVSGTGLPCATLYTFILCAKGRREETMEWLVRKPC